MSVGMGVPGAGYGGVSVASAMVDLNLNLANYTQQINQALGQTQQAAQQMERQFATAERGAGALTAAIGDTGSALRNVVQIAAGFTLGNLITNALGQVQALAQGALGTGIAFNAMKEQATLAFSTMLKSGQAGQQMMADLWSFAARTPFQFGQLETAAQRLLAMGYNAKQVIPELQTLGNAVAGLGGGAALLDRVTLAMGQIQAAGHATAQDLRQLTEAGIPAWQYLAKTLGVDVAGAMKLVEKRQVDAATTIRAINQGIAADFGNMMEVQSKTWTGLLTTLSDNWKSFLGDAMQPLFERAKGYLSELVNLLAAPGFQAFGRRIGDELGFVFDTLQRVLPVVGAGLRDLIGLLTGPLTSGLGGGGGALAMFNRALQLGADAAVTFVQALRGDWGGQFTTSINLGVRLVGDLGTAIRDLAAAAPAFLAHLWDTLYSATTSALTWLGDIWGRYLQPVVDNALVWGRNIVVQLANGIVAGAQAVVQALGFIGGLITEWLIPHSPPKLLPDLDKWGAEAATIYMQGWAKGDFSAFDDLAKELETLLRSLASVGQLPQDGVVPAILGGRGDLAAIVDALRQGQAVTTDWLDQLQRDAGPAGGAIRALVEDYQAVAAAQQDVDAAQKSLDDTTRKVGDAQRALNSAQRDLAGTTRAYEAALAPLQEHLDDLSLAQQRLNDAQRGNQLADQLADMSDPTVARLAAIDAQRQQLQDDQRRAELNKTLNDGKATDNEKAQARLELERLTLEEQRRRTLEERAARDEDLKRQQLENEQQQSAVKQQIDGIKEQEAAATQSGRAQVAAAQAALDAARQQQQAAQDHLDVVKETLTAAQARYDQQKALIGEQEKSNSLVKEQVDLLAQQAAAAERAATAAEKAATANEKSATALAKVAGAGGAAGRVAVPKVPAGAGGGAGGGAGIGGLTPAQLGLPDVPHAALPATPAAFDPLAGLAGSSGGAALHPSGVGFDAGDVSGPGRSGLPAGLQVTLDNLELAFDRIRAKVQAVKDTLASDWDRVVDALNRVRGAVEGVLNSPVAHAAGNAATTAAGAVRNALGTPQGRAGAAVGGALGGIAGGALLGPYGAIGGAALGAAGGAVAPDLAGTVYGATTTALHTFFAPTPGQPAYPREQLPPGVAGPGAPAAGPPSPGAPGKSPFERLIPDGVLEGLRAGIAGVRGALEPLAKIWGSFAETVRQQGPMLGEIGQSFKELGVALRPIGELVAKVAGAFALWEIGTLLATLGGLVEMFDKALPFALLAFKGGIDVITGVVNTFTALVEGVFLGMKLAVTGDMTGMHDELIATWNRLRLGIDQIAGGLMESVIGTIGALVAGVIGLIDGWVKTFIGFFQHIYDVIVGHSIVPDLVNEVIGWFQTLVDTVLGTVGKWKDDIVTKFSDLYTDVTTKVTTLRTDVEGAWEALKTNVTSKAEALKTDLEAKFGTLKSTLLSPFEQAAGAIKGILETFKDNMLLPLRTARDGLQNFIGGMGSVFNSIGNALPALKIHLDVPTLPQFAEGVTNWKGGLALVGEEGPELIHLDSNGLSVLPAPQTRAALTSGNIPQFAGGLNVPFISGLVDFIKQKPEVLLEKLLTAAGVSAPSLPGILEGVGPAFFTAVKDAMVQALTGWIDKALPITQDGLNKMKQAADSQVGLPYIWGGGHGVGGPGIGWDCSGYVSWVLAQGIRDAASGTVPVLYNWATQGRTGIVDIGFIDPNNPDPTQQHTGVGILGDWYEAGGRAGGVGHTADYFPIIGHPPGWEQFTQTKGGDTAAARVSFENIMGGSVTGQWSKGQVPPLEALREVGPQFWTPDGIARLVHALGGMNGMKALANGGTVDEAIIGIGASGRRYIIGEHGQEVVIPADLLPQVARYLQEAAATGNLANRFLVGLPLELRPALQAAAARYLAEGDPTTSLGLPDAPRPLPPIPGAGGGKPAAPPGAPAGGTDLAAAAAAIASAATTVPPSILAAAAAAAAAPGGTKPAGGEHLIRIQVDWAPEGKTIVGSIVTDPIALDDLTGEITTVQAHHLEAAAPRT